MGGASPWRKPQRIRERSPRCWRSARRAWCPGYRNQPVAHLQDHGGHDRREYPPTVFGARSLPVWTLIIITSVKYAGFATRIDNDGEGGILVLLALLGVKRNIARNPEMAAGGLTVQLPCTPALATPTN
ncbi:KUP/HAK/KT family potassium transporter [Dyella sp.]|uniref:KUP/HAK/KT family potassium transporter n=1 Tax=Dyella sp. TaxID=1869338 RepID=UPI002FD9278E